MPCKMCKERGKPPWFGDDPRCAFESGVFNTDNWNCATMNALRDLAEKLGTTYRDDLAAGSIGYVPFENEDYSGYIVMTWYKNRGRTDNAVVMWVDEPLRELTEEDALLALEQGKELLQG